MRAALGGVSAVSQQRYFERCYRPAAGYAALLVLTATLLAVQCRRAQHSLEPRRVLLAAPAASDGREPQVTSLAEDGHASYSGGGGGSSSSRRSSEGMMGWQRREGEHTKANGQREAGNGGLAASHTEQQGAAGEVQGGSGGKELPGPPALARHIWLYSLVPADYDGAGVLPHWLRHYLGLGIRPANFLLLVNHNPAKYTSEGLEAVTQVLQDFGVQHRVWRGQYSSEQHLLQKLLLFNEVITDLEDWILIADSDEFQDYGGMPVPAFLALAEGQGATYVQGAMVDRVAADGAMPAVAPAPSISRQFPLRCHVVSNLYGGKTKKVAAMKAFLRSNQGNHKVVPASEAPQYFGASRPGQESLRGGFYGFEDLYPLTPYHRFADRYALADQPSASGGLWGDYAYSLSITVLHFKWHAAVLRNLQDRAAYYKGSAGEGGLPRYRHYQESEKVVEALLEHGRLNLTSLQCAPTASVQQRQQERSS
ncbi:hypothetical protein N2152v2_001599 [Parachlorella kessleri]